MDPCDDAEAAAEGSSLALFKYQDLKSKKKPIPSLECFGTAEDGYVFFFFFLMSVSVGLYLYLPVFMCACMPHYLLTYFYFPFVCHFS